MTLESKSAHMTDEAVEAVTAVAKSVSRAIQTDGLLMDDSEVLQLLIAIQCNAHQIVTEEGRVVALGLFPRTSMLNHSCVANCAHRFVFEQGRPPRLQMVALQDIAVGEEVCYSYVPLYQSTASRRTLLMQAYGFVCSCARCSSSEGHDEYPDDAILDADLKGSDCSSESRALVADRLSQRLRDIAFSLVDESASKENLLAVVSELSDPEVTKLWPLSHKVLLQCYCCVAKAASLHLKHAEDGLQVDYGSDTLRDLVIGYGMLALGCIAFYTKTVELQTAEIARCVAYALRNCERFVTLVTGSEGISIRHIFTQVAQDALTASNFVYAFEPSVIQLLQTAYEKVFAMRLPIDGRDNSVDSLLGTMLH